MPPPLRPSPRPRLLGLAVGLLLAGCVPQPVAWDGEVERAPGVVEDSLRLVLADGDRPRLVPAWTPPTWPAEPAQCVATRRAARAADEGAYASWFTVRPDSSVVLRVARSDDAGRTWRAPVTADSTDVGRAGCGRPVPFVFADSVNGYVHVAYYLVGAEGAGVFFTHSMDEGALFHSVVPIVYGDRPSSASVTSHDDLVVVAFEDPNSRMPRLGLAVSRTQGHIFEARAAASDETGEARTPRVAVRGDRIALAWTATLRGGALPRVAMRLGTLVPSRPSGD